MVYHGTLKCGALKGTCRWQVTFNTHKEGFFISQEKWDITLEDTGFTSIKETVTTNPDVKGWLATTNSDLRFKITDKNDVETQWIIQSAPKCGAF